MFVFCFFFQAEDGIRDLVRSRGLGDVYKRQAVNDAMRRGEALSQEKMSGFTAGLNLPPGFKLPF